MYKKQNYNPYLIMNDLKAYLYCSMLSKSEAVRISKLLRKEITIPKVVVYNRDIN